MTAKNVDAQGFIWDAIARVPDCMMMSRDGEHLRGRPMRAIPIRESNVILFVTSKSTHKPDEMKSDPNVCLSFVDTSGRTYVSLTGAIEVLEDHDLMRGAWSKNDDAYFPQGLQDPDAVLLRFSPEFGEYWDSPSNPVLIAIEFIKAKVNGVKPSLGDNAKVAMH